jgi:hypothetical protein
MSAVKKVLASLGCTHLWPKFEEEEITTLEALQSLSRDDLTELGCKIGSRNKFLSWQKAHEKVSPRPPPSFFPGYLCQICEVTQSISEQFPPFPQRKMTNDIVPDSKHRSTFWPAQWVTHALPYSSLPFLTLRPPSTFPCFPVSRSFTRWGDEEWKGGRGEEGRVQTERRKENSNGMT